ncbi:hypothetical protein PAESOLCIP111_01064 [Paenibacillus solanacearum]|uniref:Alkaline phosphatase family protein n=1 Tax=Paenibacillus solanacearum TaxID=2048548 RepID=A0A916NHA5_9BACL|nr:alkaline phosphatase family protein [Paenibacillus solanacearum]CAG7608445.1 hypothetical protein PAESOLCIP111_01064 [Paenibacillus solanacearum]
MPGRDTHDMKAVSSSERLKDHEDSYVLYINWDAFAYEWYRLANLASNGGTPNLNALIAEGVLFTNARTGIPSITGAMQQAIVSGAWPIDTGNCFRYYNVKANKIIQYKRENALENIAEAAYRNGSSAASVNAFYFESRGTFEGDECRPYVKAPTPSGFKERVDELINIIKGEAFHTGSKTIRMNEVPRFLSIYTHTLDHLGHNLDQAMSTLDDWRQAIIDALIAMDSELGRIVQALKERGIYDQTTIFLTTDHGITPFGAPSKPETSPYPPGTLSSLPDLEKTIADTGKVFKGENFKTEILFRDGEQARPETEVVIMTAGLEAHIQFRVPAEQAVLDEIVSRMKQKEYYGTHLFRADLFKRGLPLEFADILISPKPPYHFKTGNPNLVRWAMGQHDSLDESSQHIFAMISGAAVRKGIICDDLVYNISMAPTMARVLGFEGPSGATAPVLDEILAEMYKGPMLAISELTGDDLTVYTDEVVLRGETVSHAAIRINGKHVGEAEADGRFMIQQKVAPGMNRLIVEAIANDRITRKCIFAAYILPVNEQSSQDQPDLPAASG